MDIRDIDMIRNKEEYIFLRYLRFLFFGQKAFNNKGDIVHISIEMIATHFELFKALLIDNKYGYYTKQTEPILREIQKQFFITGQGKKTSQMHAIFESGFAPNNLIYEQLYTRRMNGMMVEENEVTSKIAKDINRRNRLEAVPVIGKELKNYNTFSIEQHASFLTFDYYFMIDWLKNQCGNSMGYYQFALLSLRLILSEYPTLLIKEGRIDQHISELLEIILGTTIEEKAEQEYGIIKEATNIQKRIQFLNLF